MVYTLAQRRKREEPIEGNNNQLTQSTKQHRRIERSGQEEHTHRAENKKKQILDKSKYHFTSFLLHCHTTNTNVKRPISLTPFEKK